MTRMNSLWGKLFQTLLGSLLACGLGSGSAMTFADEEPKKDRVQEDFELMKQFVETFEQIDTNYVRDVDRRELMQAAIQGMLDHLDQYSTYIPREDVRRFEQIVEQEFGGVGIDVSIRGDRLTVISPLPGTPAFRAGIRPGDVIVEVDGTSTEGFRVPDAVKVLQGPPGRPVTLGIRRGGEGDVEQIAMTREVIQVPTVHGHHFNESGEWEFMLDEQHKIGYIRMSHFSRHTVEEIQKALSRLTEHSMKGLVLDLRSNPGGLLEAAIEIADLFLESGEIVSVKGRNVPFRSWKAKKGDAAYPAFPMAILVNRFSASASEVLSACLQDNNRAIVVGERTWGKGSVQNVIRLESDESALKLTTASYHRPSGINIHRFPGAGEDEEWGVKPSTGFEVSFTSEQMDQWFRERRQQEIIRPAGTPAPEQKFDDLQLGKAVAWLNEQVSAAVSTASTPAAPEEKNPEPPK